MSTTANPRVTPDWWTWKNGTLLSAAEQAGFDAVITTDQEIPHQENLRLRRMSIITLCAETNRLTDLKKLVRAVLSTLPALLPGQANHQRRLMK